MIIDQLWDQVCTESGEYTERPELATKFVEKVIDHCARICENAGAQSSETMTECVHIHEKMIVQSSIMQSDKLAKAIRELSLDDN